MAAINRRFLNSECLPIGPFNINVIDPVKIANAEAQCCFHLREITARWLDATLLSTLTGDDLNDCAVSGNTGIVQYVELNPVVASRLVISQQSRWCADLGQYHVLIAVPIDVRIRCSATDNRTRQVVVALQRDRNELP